MPPRVSIRPARGAEDVLAALFSAHAGRQGGLPRLADAARRLSGAYGVRSTWWVLEEQGRVVCCLRLYALDWRRGEETRRGYGLGGVATLPEARRRGHASALCAAACEAAEAEGAGVGLLYSAIPPAFYERIGFRVVPATSPRCERLVDLAASGPVAALTPIDPRKEAEALCRTFREVHGHRWHLDRTPQVHLQSLAESHSQWFFRVDGEAGYVRLSFEDGEIDVSEWALRDPERAEPVLRTVAKLGSEVGAKALTGWFDVPEGMRDWFSDAGRAKTLPMVRAEDDVTAPVLWSPDYF